MRQDKQQQQQWWLRQVQDWALDQNVQKEDLANYSPVSLALVHSKVVKGIILSVIPQHTQDHKGSGSTSACLGLATPAWSTWSPFMTRWLTWWMRKRLWLCLLGLQQSLWHYFLWHFPGKTGTPQLSQGHFTGLKTCCMSRPREWAASRCFPVTYCSLGSSLELSVWA